MTPSLPRKSRPLYTAYCFALSFKLVKFYFIKSIKNYPNKKWEIYKLPILDSFCYKNNYLKYNEYTNNSGSISFYTSIVYKICQEKSNIIHESLVKIFLNPHLSSQCTQVSNRNRVKIFS